MSYVLNFEDITELSRVPPWDKWKEWILNPARPISQTKYNDGDEHMNGWSSDRTQRQQQSEHSRANNTVKNDTF